MMGLSSHDGTWQTDLDHLRQSIRDILTTPIGTRVMRRDYGSRLHELVDGPTNRALFVEITVAVAEALDRWEPRIRVSRVRVDAVHEGVVTLTLTGTFRDTGSLFTLNELSV